MPPAGPPRDSQSSIRTSQPTPIIVPNPKVKYSTVLRLPCSRSRCAIRARTITAARSNDPVCGRTRRPQSAQSCARRTPPLRGGNARDDRRWGGLTSLPSLRALRSTTRFHRMTVVKLRVMTHQPRASFQSPRFAQPATFMRLPHVEDPHGLDVAIVGVPYDGGTSYRPGARLGPREIRSQSSLIRSYSYFLKVAPFDRLNVADSGDIDAPPVSIEK